MVDPDMPCPKALDQLLYVSCCQEYKISFFFKQFVTTNIFKNL